MRVISLLAGSVVFWLAWIIIPLTVELIPALGGILVLIKKKIQRKPASDPDWFPDLSVIVPVYRSEETLSRCLESVAASRYPADKIEVLLINNGSMDKSRDIYLQFQREHPHLRMYWMNAKEGKSKALNLALHNSEGSYIVHIDSDGWLHPDALLSMVRKFEAEPDLDGATGVILNDPEQIGSGKTLWKRILGRLEFCEYAQAFLAGRNYEAESNAIFTLSGAFSAFRRSAIFQTKLYNSDTVAEDAHVTFQLKYNKNCRIGICTEALFFVEPITGLGELYTQRQRWQRGALEVSHMFLKDRMNRFRGLGNPDLRTLLYDHTFAFPRMIWYFASISLLMYGYAPKTVLSAGGLILLCYVVLSYLYFFVILGYLNGAPELKRWYRSLWGIPFLLPVYNFVLFWFRMAGMINGIRRKNGWRTFTFQEEWRLAADTVRSDFSWVYKLHRGLTRWMNKEEEE